MIKAIFFDSGNVLVYEGFTPGVPLCETRHNIPKGQLYQSTHDRQYWKDFTLGKITEAEYFTKVAEDFKGQLDITELKKTIYETSQPNRELLEFIKTLKHKYILGIISNNPKEWLEYFWQNFGWNKIFDVRAVSAEVHIRKPDAKIFQYALDRAGVTGPESIYVDDRPDRISGAQEAGMNIIIYKNLKQLKLELSSIK